jgi:hypothetical protein
MYKTDFGHMDETLISDGIAIAYYDNSKKRKVRLIVCPCFLLDNDCPELWKPTPGNISRLTHKLDKRIASYFSGYELADFKMSQVILAADIDVGDRDRVSDYIKILHSIGKVKCFSPVKYRREGLSKDSYFGLVGNSNGLEFRAYGLEHAKKVLRAEVRLRSKSVIRACAGNGDTANQIGALAERGEDIFMEAFRHVVPGGNYYKKKQAETLIRERVRGGPLRRRMLRLVTLIPEKKSLHLAQKALTVRDINEVMSKFNEIGVSPVTISKRHNRKELVSLYSLLEP